MYFRPNLNSHIV